MTPVRFGGGAIAAMGLLLGAMACAPRPADQARLEPRILTEGAPDTARLSPRMLPEPSPVEREYVAYVVSESVDEVSRIVFGPQGARLDKVVPVGISMTDPDGPHGVALSPDGEFYYVTTAHGIPGGDLWKFRRADDTPLGRITLGPFPATAQVSPNGWYVWAVNFNLHGEMVTSSVSVVETGAMIEIARVETCTMPHGSRLNPAGTRHYSACMMDDAMVEIDAERFGVTRHFLLTGGKEQGRDGAPPKRRLADAAHAGHDMGGHGLEPPKPGDVSCSPTWAQPSADGTRIWVACNKSSEIVEVDVASWSLLRRIPAGPGVYNLAVTHDGRLLIGTNKRGQSISVFDTQSGRELARIPTSKRVTHGAAVTSDDRYAFITNEGVGSEKATVDVIDLRALRVVATVEVGQQAGGVDVLK
ncbi:MAG: YncE family protein [Gemmatimonadaceae bacterium]|nr:YncE family protein [Gemmatimonadaceae bacterium]